MSSLAHYGPREAADGSDAVKEVRAYLAARAVAACAAGVPRWAVVLDPGLGFAKQAAHSFALLRPAGRLDERGAAGGGELGLAGFPLLYGPSRKRFLGGVLRPREVGGGGDLTPDLPLPSQRVWATAAAVTAAIALGAEFVRVHDVPPMRDVVDVADAIYRNAGVAPPSPTI